MLQNGKLINTEIRIENTNLCNAHCVICPREKMTRPKTTMCWGVFCNLVDQAVELGAKTVSVFGYGEPLLDKNLEEKIGYCSDLGLNTWLTTNGSVLSMQRSFDLLNAGLKNIRFSIHAVTPLQYEKVHRGLKWLDTIRNVANFLHINKRAGNPVTTHLTNIPLAGEDTEQIRETWESSFDFLEIWKPHNWGGKKQYRRSNPGIRSCGRPFSGPVQVQSDGSVIPCCFLTNAEVVLGNINNDPLLTVLMSDKYEQFRDMHRIGDYSSVPCETCDQRNIDDKPLLFSNRDPDKKIGKTSTCKIDVAKPISIT